MADTSSIEGCRLGWNFEGELVGRGQLTSTVDIRGLHRRGYCLGSHIYESIAEFEWGLYAGRHYGADGRVCFGVEGCDF